MLQIHCYYSKIFLWLEEIPETADCAFELPLISVDCLVLLQGVLVPKGLATDETSEARLAVNLLVGVEFFFRAGGNSFLFF